MYLIIGQGAAGTAAARRLRELDETAAITVVTDEVHSYYSRVDLPDIVAGKMKPQSATLLTDQDFTSLRIVCQSGASVSRILPAAKEVELLSGERLRYHRLLLATGSRPIVPRIPGVQLSGVHTLWTMADALALQSAAARAERAVVIGAGLIGLKTALALQSRGVKTTVIEQQTRLLPRQMDEAASQLLCAALSRRGLELQLGTQVDAILSQDGQQVSAVAVGSEQIPCDLLVLAVGVKPNVALVQTAGLSVDRGILVDRGMRSSDPHIFAAGDVAAVADRLTGLPVVPAIWPAAVEQGRLAAESMLGMGGCYAGNLARNSIEIAGLPVVSLGDVFGEAEDCVLSRQRGDIYLKLVSREGVLRGALLVGEIAAAGLLAGLIERGQPIDARRLLQGEDNYISALQL